MRYFNLSVPGVLKQTTGRDHSAKISELRRSIKDSEMLFDKIRSLASNGNIDLYIDDTDFDEGETVKEL